MCDGCLYSPAKFLPSHISLIKEERCGNGTCVVTSNTGVVQVRWFILTHHGVGHTHKNSMVGHFSGSVRVILLKSTHQWGTSTASFSSCQQPCLHGASSSNNGGTVALFCHGMN